MAASGLKDRVATALQKSEYDPANIELLESYVKEQIQTNTYDFAANKALLKIYQFNPSRMNEQAVALLLTKALMALPSSDMMLLLYLVPDSVKTKEPIFTLIRCHELLEAARFVEFWEVANLGGNELLDEIEGFDEAMREYIISVLSVTYQKIESDIFMDLMALDDDILDDYVSEKKDKLSLEDKQIVFTANPHNQPQPKKFRENISFENMAPVVSLLNSQQA